MEQTFELHPLFFTYKDRELVETIKQLSVAPTGSDESAKKLWKNLFALIKDAN